MNNEGPSTNPLSQPWNIVVVALAGIAMVFGVMVAGMWALSGAQAAAAQDQQPGTAPAPAPATSSPAPAPMPTQSTPSAPTTKAPSKEPSKKASKAPRTANSAQAEDLLDHTWEVLPKKTIRLLCSGAKFAGDQEVAELMVETWQKAGIDDGIKTKDVEPVIRDYFDANCD